MILLTTKLSEFYKEEFKEAAESLDITIKEIDLDNINIIYGSPSIIYDNNKNEIICDAFMARATNNKYAEIYSLVKALESQNCIMLDSVSRFTGNKPNKIKTSISRSINNIGAKTIKLSNIFINNNNEFVLTLLPIFAKPIDGKQNKGLKRIETINELIEYNNGEFILQQNLNIIDEYRVLAYNHGDNFQVLGITHKKTIGLKGKNLKRKYKIKDEQKDKLINLLKSNKYISNNIGLFGYDIAKLEDESLVVIESNRSPMWERTERIRNVNIAKEILLILKEKYERRNTV